MNSVASFRALQAPQIRRFQRYVQARFGRPQGLARALRQDLAGHVAGDDQQAFFRRLTAVSLGFGQCYEVHVPESQAAPQVGRGFVPPQTERLTGRVDLLQQRQRGFRHGGEDIATLRPTIRPGVAGIAA